MKYVVTFFSIFVAIQAFGNGEDTFLQAKKMFEKANKISAADIPFPGSAGLQAINLKSICAERYQSGNYVVHNVVDSSMRIAVNYDWIPIPEYTLRSGNGTVMFTNSNGKDFGSDTKEVLETGTVTSKVYLRRYLKDGKRYYFAYSDVVYGSQSWRNYCWSPASIQ